MYFVRQRHTGVCGCSTGNHRWGRQDRAVFLKAEEELA